MFTELDPNYGTYAKVAWGYNAAFLEIREPGEAGILIRLPAAKRLLEVLPALIEELALESTPY